MYFRNQAHNREIDRQKIETEIDKNNTRKCDGSPTAVLEKIINNMNSFKITQPKSDFKSKSKITSLKVL